MASDHAGVALKSLVVDYLKAKGHTVEDLGVNNPKESVDYPDCAKKVVSKIQASPDATGILICGTGIGMSIAANRAKGVRAALCLNEFMAHASRAHNNANVLCLGERILGPSLALSIVSAFINATFEGGRHERRVQKLDD